MLSGVRGLLFQVNNKIYDFILEVNEAVLCNKKRTPFSQRSVQ